MTATTTAQADLAFAVHTEVRNLGNMATSALLDALCEMPDTDSARTHIEEAQTLVFRMLLAVDEAEAQRLPGMEPVKATVEKIERNVQRVHAKIEG